MIIRLLAKAGDEDPSKMVSAATGLHCNDAGPKFSRQRDQGLPVGAPPPHTFPLASRPTRLQTFLPMSNGSSLQDGYVDAE
jgi:hypothetical protein